MTFRVGFGFDVHQLTTGRDFWLGGELIPYTKGALGHSDADVLLHAICDALLGAANLGDIGTHFPDTSSDFKDIDSKILLQKSFELIQAQGWQIENIDSTICLEKPKVMMYAPQMKGHIAKACSLDISSISIKATTNEKMGFVGREEGIAAYAVVMLKKG
ncbi:MAG: 2-C-methyl-D-erythritol 2,4-cyclodiphosphate synthase [Flavobacteriales bacterium]|nr:2-C-methyl-D-erythritol 2,4-cyclodiphosphate synthase [Flavobacteriales bacterium]